MNDSAAPKMQWLQVDPQDAFEDIRDKSILSYFPGDFLDILSTFGESRMFAKNEVILREGDLNKELFFLLSGSVEIQIDEKAEYKLCELGEVFGEMSLIAEAACTATVMAREDSCFLVFNHDEIKNIVEDNKEEFGYVLFNVFSKVLTKRLTDANKHLNMVEEKNQELTRMSREIEWVAHERFRELWGKGNFIYDHLEKVFNGDMAKLLKDFESENPPSHEDIRQKLDAMQDGVKPLFEMYNQNKSLQAKRVLLVTNSKSARSLVKTALVGTGVNLRIASSREHAFKTLNEEPFDLLLVSPELMGLSEVAVSLNENIKCVLLTERGNGEFIEDLRKYPHVGNVVLLHESARVFALKNIFTSVGKLANEDLFGMEKYLNWGVEVKKSKVENSENRSLLLAEMTQEFEGAGLRSVVIDRCRSVAEELLMNVVYDAPVDAKGKPKYNHYDRSKPVELKTHEQGYFQFACDGVLAAVAVQDPFGNFDHKTLTSYLDVWNEDHEDSRENKAGGGYGLKVVIEMADFVVFNVRKGMKTEVIAFFNIDRKAESFFDGPFFHVFYE